MSDFIDGLFQYMVQALVDEKTKRPREVFKSSQHRSLHTITWSVRDPDGLETVLRVEWASCTNGKTSRIRFMKNGRICKNDVYRRVEDADPE